MMIDWSGLEEFRKSLPIDGELNFQNEQFSFRLFPFCWDIVKAQFLLNKIPHELGKVDVTRFVKVLGLPKKQDDLSLYYVDERRVMDKLVDLRKPLILAHVIYDVFNGSMVIDGHARLTKAFRYGFDYLPAYKLTHEEEMACRI